jgi:hypothetical protein
MLAFKFIYVDPADSHFPDRVRKTTVKGKISLIKIKGALKRQELVLKGANEQAVTLEFFRKNPAMKLFTITPVPVTPDADSLAALCTPRASNLKAKIKARVKEINPASTAGFRSYVQTLGQTLWSAQTSAA